MGLFPMYLLLYDYLRIIIEVSHHISLLPDNMALRLHIKPEEERKVFPDTAIQSFAD